MIFKSGRKASPLTSLLDIILLVLFAQNIINSDLALKKAEKEIDMKYQEDIKNKDESIKTNAKTIEEINKELDETRANYNKDTKDKNDRIKYLENQLNSKKNDLNIADTNLEKLKKIIASNTLIISSLEEKNKSLESENNSLKEEIAKNKDENTKLVSENNDLNNEKKILDVANIKLKKDVDLKIKENDNLQNKIQEINIAMEKQIDEFKRFVEENSKELEQVKGTKELVTVRKILTSAKALEQLKHIVIVVEVLLYKDKIIIRLNGYEEKIFMPEEEKLVEDEISHKIIDDKCKEFRHKLSDLFDKAGENKKEVGILLIPSSNKEKLPDVCWEFFKKMYDSGLIKDFSFIKDLYMPNNYLHIKEN